MHAIHGGLGVRHNDDLDRKSFIGGLLPGVCLWMSPLWLNWGRVYFNSDSL